MWRACDGRTTVAAVAARLPAEVGLAADPAVAELALWQLARARLLADPLPVGEVRWTRRDLARRLKLAGGLALLPLVMSLVAPTPGVAATNEGAAVGIGCPNHRRCRRVLLPPRQLRCNGRPC